MRRADIKTNEIHEALLPLLPTTPSPSSPTILTLTPPESPPSLPLTYLYVLSHISKGLIKQAATEVSAKQDAAFPLARIVLGLLLRGHAALGDVLMARLVKKCPLVVPFYPTRQQVRHCTLLSPVTCRRDDPSKPPLSRLDAIGQE